MSDNQGVASLQARGVAQRVTIEAGDFFETVPAGGDAYLLSHIIHDWNEEQCLTILGHCRRVIKPDGRVLIVETVLPEREHERWPDPERAWARMADAADAQGEGSAASMARANLLRRIDAGAGSPREAMSAYPPMGSSGGLFLRGGSVSALTKCRTSGTVLPSRVRCSVAMSRNSPIVGGLCSICSAIWSEGRSCGPIPCRSQ